MTVGLSARGTAPTPEYEEYFAVLNPSPQDLRVALARYADARIHDDRFPTDSTAGAVEDAAYTLCVMTGTRDVPQALSIADALLGEHTTIFPVGSPRTVSEQGEGLQAA